MSYKRSTAAMCMALMLVAADSGADPLQQSTAASEQRPLGATGVPIDPAKKTVHVGNALGKTQKPKQTTAQLRAQQAKTHSRLAKHIESYSGNIDNVRGKEKVTTEMAGDLETYKRQSLELYKRQHRGRSAMVGNEPVMRQVPR